MFDYIIVNTNSKLWNYPAYVILYFIICEEMPQNKNSELCTLLAV